MDLMERSVQHVLSGQEKKGDSGKMDILVSALDHSTVDLNRTETRQCDDESDSLAIRKGISQFIFCNLSIPFPLLLSPIGYLNHHTRKPPVDLPLLQLSK